MSGKKARLARAGTRNASQRLTNRVLSKPHYRIVETLLGHPPHAAMNLYPGAADGLHEILDLHDHLTEIGWQLSDDELQYNDVVWTDESS